MKKNKDKPWLLPDGRWNEESLHVQVKGSSKATKGWEEFMETLLSAKMLIDDNGDIFILDSGISFKGYKIWANGQHYDGEGFSLNKNMVPFNGQVTLKA